MGTFLVQLFRVPFLLLTKGREPSATKESLLFQVNSFSSCSRHSSLSSEQNRALPSRISLLSKEQALSWKSLLTRFYFFLEMPSWPTPFKGGTSREREKKQTPAESGASKNGEATIWLLKTVV